MRGTAMAWEHGVRGSCSGCWVWILAPSSPCPTPGEVDSLLLRPAWDSPAWPTSLAHGDGDYGSDVQLPLGCLLPLLFSSVDGVPVTLIPFDGSFCLSFHVRAMPLLSGVLLLVLGVLQVSLTRCTLCGLFLLFSWARSAPPFL